MIPLHNVCINTLGSCVHVSPSSSALGSSMAILCGPSLDWTHINPTTKTYAVAWPKKNAHGTRSGHPSGQESSLSRTHESSPATLVEHCAFDEWRTACKTQNSHWVNSFNQDRSWRGHFLQTLDNLPGITLTTLQCKTPAMHAPSGKACLGFGCLAPPELADCSSSPQWMLRHLQVPTRCYALCSRPHSKFQTNHLAPRPLSRTTKATTESHYATYLVCG